MRVLFVSLPGVAHVFPAVPLAWALRAAGHDVVMATAAAGLRARESGLSVADVRPGLQLSDLTQLMAKTSPGTAEALRSMRTNMEIVPDAFVVLSTELTEGTVDFARQWRPDLIVHSPMHGGALVAAAILRVPAVSLGFGFARSGRLQPVMFVRMRETFARHGVEAVPHQTANIDIAPPSMLDGPPQGWSMRPVPYSGGAVLPRWLLERPPRPRIGVTLGTVSARIRGLGPASQVVKIADRIDAEFVLALGDADPSELGQLPPNVRNAGWVPWDALCASSSAVIHHGGAGTMLTALDAAVPQLVLPDGADRYINADALAARGAGLVGDPADVDAGLVDQLLTEDRFRGNAADVSMELRTMPTPAELADRLSSFVSA